MTKHDDTDTTASDRQHEGGLSRLSPARGDDKFFYHIDRLSRRMEHLREEGQRALILNNSNLVQQYFGGNRSLLVYFEVGGGDVDADNPPIFDDGGTYVLEYHKVGTDIETRDPKRNEDRHEKPVLVRIVEFPDGPEDIVPSLVRLYRVGDKRAKSAHSSLYGGIRADFEGLAPDVLRLRSEGSYELVPRFVGGKGDAGTLPIQDLVDSVVERASQTVDEVADEQRQFGWCRLPKSNSEYLPQFPRGIAVTLHVDRVEFCFEEALPYGMKPVKVMIGPLEF